jgi:hypothetical protein
MTYSAMVVVRSAINMAGIAELPAEVLRGSAGWSVAHGVRRLASHFPGDQAGGKAVGSAQRRVHGITPTWSSFGRTR